MAIIQVSTLLEDRPGQLSQISRALGKKGINMIGLMIATKFGGGKGLFRFVCSRPDEAVAVLEDLGYQADTREVLAIQTPHHPGGMSAILGPLAEAGINVNHLYPAIGTADSGQTVLFLGVDDLKQAQQALRSNWIIMVGDEIFDGEQ